MSLINDMLNDLEQRHATDLQRPGLKGEVRPLPRMQLRERYGRHGVVVAIAILVAGFGYWFWPVAKPSAPVKPPAAQNPQKVAPAPIAVKEEIQEEIVDTSSFVLPDGLGLKTATSLALITPRTAVEPKKDVGAKTPDEKMVARPVAAEPPNLAAAVKSPEDSKAVPVAKPVAKPAQGVIEKQVVYANPRERLEYDYRNAVQAASTGQMGEAIELLRAILRQDPGYSQARQALLKIYLDQRRADEMMQLLTEGLDLQPTQIGWATSLARLYVERGDYTSAQRILARSYPFAALNPEYLGFFGHVQYRLNHPREAAELYLGATKVAPAEGRWWLGLGVALEADGRAAEAKEAFRKALASGSLSADLAALAEQKVR